MGDMCIKKMFTMLCPIGAGMVKCITAHIKLAIAIVMVILISIAVYSAMHWGIFHPSDTTPREVPFK